MTVKDTEQSPSNHQSTDRFFQDGLALAGTWRIRGRWADALTLVRGLLPVTRELGDATVAQQCLAIGRVLTDMATFGGIETRDEREAALNDALRYAESSGQAALVGDVCDAQGMSLHVTYLDSDRSREFEQELTLFTRGLSFRQQGADQAAIAESLFHVGLVYGVVRSDHVRALPYFEDAYQRATAAHDLIMGSYAIRHIAFARHAAGNTSAALSALEESLRLREAAQFIPGVAMTYMTLAYPYIEAGDKATAANYLMRAKAIFESLDAPRRVSEVNHQLAEL